MLEVRIAATPFSISCDDVSMADALRRRYAAFCTQGGESSVAPWRVTVVVDPPFTQQVVDDVVRTESLGEARITFSRGDFIAEVDRAARRAVVRTSESVVSFNAFLRVLLARELVERGGLLLHASSILAGDEVFVFVGPSGAGKTTLARLALSEPSAGRHVLSDEVTAVVPDNDGYRCHGTPFWGDLALDDTARHGLVRHCYFPRHATTGFWQAAVGLAAATRRVAACTFAFERDPMLTDKTLASCERFASTLRPAELHFALDAAVWRHVDA